MSVRRIAVVTGTRAEFGLLTPVMREIQAHQDLRLLTVACGAHFLGDMPTVRDVDAVFTVDAMVPMQRDGDAGRASDAQALGRGVTGLSEAFGELDADAVVVLGDRIEAFAAASAASVMGVPVAHLHGGDVAEGVADEAMRHAITKLAHLHLPATANSADRIERMGEHAWRIFNIGSPAADVVRLTPELGDEEYAALGSPDTLVLHHPSGLASDEETAYARAIADAIDPGRTLWLAPNHDAGRESIQTVRADSGARSIDHLPSAAYTGLLKRLARLGGVLIGNSSSALIEGAIVGLHAVDIGPRQRGRERCENAHHAESPRDVRPAIDAAREQAPDPAHHPYGDGYAGGRVVDLLACTEFSDPRWLRKRNAY